MSLRSLSFFCGHFVCSRIYAILALQEVSLRQLFLRLVFHLFYAFFFSELLSSFLLSHGSFHADATPGSFRNLFLNIFVGFRFFLSFFTRLFLFISCAEITNFTKKATKCALSFLLYFNIFLFFPWNYYLFLEVERNFFVSLFCGCSWPLSF